MQMLSYNLQLATRSLRQQKLLTTLMIVAVGLGIGASVTTITLYRALSADPLPEKSARLFYPQMDPRSLEEYRPGSKPERQLTRRDAVNLLTQSKGIRQAMMSRGSSLLRLPESKRPPSIFPLRYTTPDFFSLFSIPFEQGRGWSQQEEEARARIVVISQNVQRKLFPSGQAIGKELILGKETFTVIGVTKNWNPQPRFYDLSTGHYQDAEEIFLPFLTSRELGMQVEGSQSCWGDPPKDDPEGQHGMNAPCTWIQYWVELAPEKADQYRRYLEQYSSTQHEHGRFERPNNVRLLSLNDWLEENEVIPRDVALQLWLSLGFLVVCLVNTIGLLLTKYLRRTAQLSVRRALGASRAQIFAQLLTEAAVVGLAGGVLGLIVAQLGLWLVRLQPYDHAKLASMDLTMLLATFGISALCMLLAGCLPALRVSRIPPAQHLRSQ